MINVLFFLAGFFLGSGIATWAIMTHYENGLYEGNFIWELVERPKKKKKAHLAKRAKR